MKEFKKRVLALSKNKRLLFKAAQKVGELGIVGENRIVLALIITCISRWLRKPGSALLKGAASSGKTQLVSACTQLFPPSCVIERAGLSGKALAYGKGSLAGKILYINEYRCGRDAQQLLRLLQSGEEIKHEATSVRGSRRQTNTVLRAGTPVVLTTTTDSVVFEDDETRFVSLYADDSPDQSRAVLVARASAPSNVDHDDLVAWQQAMSQLKPRKGDFLNPPEFLRFVAEHVPCDDVRVRRDFDRFLVFCEAVALCRRPLLQATQALNITFTDYCVTYKIFEPIFASTLRGVPSREMDLGRAVAILNRRHGRAVSVKEVTTELGWKASLIYKYLRRARRHRLVEYEEGGPRENNLKRLTAKAESNYGFLPRPRIVFDRNPEIGKEARYVNPFTGKTIVMRRKRAHGLPGMKEQ